MTYDFIKGKIWTQTHTQEECLVKMKADQGDASTSQGTLKTAGKPPEAW